MKNIIYIALLLLAQAGTAQNTKTLVYEGNQLYGKGDLSKAAAKYRQALEKKPADATANFNLGNVQFKQGDYEEAVKSFENINAEDKMVQAQALYNKGVALAKQQKLQAAADAFKESLKKNPADEDCRYNLAMVLGKLKKQQQQQQQKEQENKKDPKKDKQKQEQQKPKLQPPKLNKQQVQQVLQMVRQKEKSVQQKVNQKQTPGVVQNEKDW